MMVKEAEARLAALLDRVNAVPGVEKIKRDRSLSGCVQLIGSHNCVTVHMHYCSPPGQVPDLAEASNDS